MYSPVVSVNSSLPVTDLVAFGGGLECVLLLFSDPEAVLLLPPDPVPSYSSAADWGTCFR